MASGTVRAFRDQLNNYVRDVRFSHVQWVRRVAAAAHRAAYRHTPIDTSRAMSGWTASVGTPFKGEPKYTAGSKGSTMSEAVQINEGNIKETAEAYKFGKKYYIRNNVEYIEKLEAGPGGGGSPQAPNGMMSFAIDAALQEMKR